MNFQIASLLRKKFFIVKHKSLVLNKLKKVKKKSYFSCLHGSKLEIKKSPGQSTVYALGKVHKAYANEILNFMPNALLSN